MKQKLKIIQQIGNIFIPRREESLSELNMKPGELFHISDEKNSGICGCIYATQIELNRQITYNPIKKIEFKEKGHKMESSTNKAKLCKYKLFIWINQLYLRFCIIFCNWYSYRYFYWSYCS